MELLASAALEAQGINDKFLKRFKRLPGRVNIEVLPDTEQYICRMPGCNYQSNEGALEKTARKHAERKHKGGGKVHVYQEPRAADLEHEAERIKRQRELHATRQARRRKKRRLQLTEHRSAQAAPIVDDSGYCWFPAEWEPSEDVPPGWGGAAEGPPSDVPQGRVCGVGCFRLELPGGGDVMPSATLIEAGLEAVQDAVTVVTANLPVLQRWLGGSSSSSHHHDSKPRLWNMKKERLRVDLSEIRGLTCGRSLAAAAVVCIVCMATGRIPDPSMAVTGDMDLRGNLRAVEGLHAKLEACRTKGLRAVLIPRASYEGVDRTAWSQELKDYADRAVRCVTHVVEVLEIMIQGCPRLPTSLSTPCLAFVGVGYSLRHEPKEASQAGPAETLMVEVCQRQPGRGQVIITGHTPGPKLCACVLEAQAWVMQRCLDISAALGCTRTSKSSLIARLHNPQCDLHVHFGGGWDKMDWPLYGGAVGVAMVSFMTGKMPRTDVAVVGAVTTRGRLVSDRAMQKQEVEWMQQQGFQLVVAPGDSFSTQPEALRAEMASRGMEMVSTLPYDDDFLPVLPHVFGVHW